jgi:hypothetical protein
MESLIIIVFVVSFDQPSVSLLSLASNVIVVVVSAFMGVYKKAAVGGWLVITSVESLQE